MASTVRLLSLLRTNNGAVRTLRSLPSRRSDAAFISRSWIIQQIALRRMSSSTSTILSQLLDYGDMDYDAARAYDPVVPEHFNFARDFIDEWAKRDEASKETHLAFWYVGPNDQEFKWTYLELSAFSQKAANALVETGVNDAWRRCILMLPKVPEWWTINLAIQRLGAQAVHATTQLTAKDIEYRLRVSKAQCVVTNETLADAVDLVAPQFPQLTTKILVSSGKAARPGWHNFGELYEKAASRHQCRPTRSDDTLHLFFTSGTTSMPKLVEHSHSSLGIGHYFLGRYVLELNRSRVMWNIADPGWAKTAWSSFFVPWSAGATVFIHHMPQFNPMLIIKTLAEKSIHAFCAPPTVYRMMLMLPIPKFPTMQTWFSAGEPLNSEVIKQWYELTGREVREGYGQTETPALIGRYPGRPRRPGAMGEPCPYLKMAIVDDNGVEQAPGTEANIAVCVKPNPPLGLFKGYEDDPEKTAASFVGDYYITGDLGYKDEDGYYFFSMRRDDVITSAAYRIGPFEVESALQEHPDVVEAAAVGSPDPTRGEVVKAFVVLKPEAKIKDQAALIKELQDHVKRVTAPYKYPRKIEFVESLPKTISGKTKRAELRQLERERALGGANEKQKPYYLRGISP